MERLFASGLILFAAIGPVGVARADDGVLCRAAIAATERATGIPEAFLFAIGRVESGRPVGGDTVPWPWTINAAGQGHFYSSKAEAVAAARAFQAAGVRSIDVGCLQVNLAFHPEAFTSLDAAFDPAANAAFAGRFLRSLHDETGSWPRAAAAYHSQTPALGAAYQSKVLDAWALPDESVRAAAPPYLSSFPAPPPRSQPAGAAGKLAALQPLPQLAAVPALPAPRVTQRILLPSGGAGGQGRTLAAYRAMPVRIAARAVTAPAGP